MSHECPHHKYLLHQTLIPLTAYKIFHTYNNYLNVMSSCYYISSIHAFKCFLFILFTIFLLYNFFMSLPSFYLDHISIPWSHCHNTRSFPNTFLYMFALVNWLKRVITRNYNRQMMTIYLSLLKNKCKNHYFIKMMLKLVCVSLYIKTHFQGVLHVYEN